MSCWFKLVSSLPKLGYRPNRSRELNMSPISVSCRFLTLFGGLSRLSSWLFLCLIVFTSHKISSPRFSLSPAIANAAPSPAPSSPKDRAKKIFSEGRSAYQDGRYEEALQHFEKAYRTFPVPLMLFNIASTYEQLGLLPQAIDRFKSFVASGKDTKGEAKEKVEALSALVKEWVEVLVTTSPNGAQVRAKSAQGPLLGTTPTSIKLPPNREVSLHITPRAGTPFIKVFTLKDNPKVQRLNFELPKQPAYVRVVGSPTEATVKSGAQSVRGLPALLELSVGDHDIELLAPGYLPIKRSVSLTRSHTQAAPLSLEVKLKGSEGIGLIAINIENDGTLLYVDGDPRGQSPFNEPIELSAGEHLIELKGPKGEQHSERVTLRAGETTTISPSFAKGDLILSKKYVSLGLIGVGGASLITGIVLGAVALNTSSNLDECRQHELCLRRQGELDRATAVKAYALSADILMGLGLAVGAAGGVLFWLDRSHNKEPAVTSPDIQVMPTQGGLMIDGRFVF